MIFYNKFPIVFTQDENFVDKVQSWNDMAQTGDVVLLPSDALLIFPDMPDDIYKLITHPKFMINGDKIKKI